MKMKKWIIIAFIMTVLVAGTVFARATHDTPEKATEAFIRWARSADTVRWLPSIMADDAAAFFILYADTNKILNFFNNKGDITKIEQVSNDGNVAVTKVTFKNGSEEQFKLVKGRYEWLIASQLPKRN